MSRTDNLYQLPENLPLPVDDGATNHLLGLQLPSIPLMSTVGIVLTWKAFLTRLLCSAIHALGNLMETSRKVGMKFPEPEAVRPSLVHFETITKSYKHLVQGVLA